MPSTISEKILSRLAGRTVRPGEELRVKPDFVLAYAALGYADMYLETMEKEFGIERVSEPERYGIFIDHNIPATTEKNETMHVATRAWCAKHCAMPENRRANCPNWAARCSMTIAAFSPPPSPGCAAK